MPKIVVEIEWNFPDDQRWLNALNIEGVLGTHYKRTAFDVVELDKDQSWTETRYKWASIINRLACMFLNAGFTENDRDYANDMIEMVNPYLGLAEE